MEAFQTGPRKVIFRTDSPCSYWNEHHVLKWQPSFVSTFTTNSTFKHELFTALRHAIFCVITQRVVAISYRRFGTTYRSHLQESSYPIFLDLLNHKSLKSRTVHNTLCSGVQDNIFTHGAVKPKSKVWQRPSRCVVTKLYTVLYSVNTQLYISTVILHIHSGHIMATCFNSKRSSSGQQGTFLRYKDPTESALYCTSKMFPIGLKMAV